MNPTHGAVSGANIKPGSNQHKYSKDLSTFGTKIYL